jgi:hypothetical protein
VILALFTGAAVSATAVPEAAYGHIATNGQVAPAEIVSAMPLTAARYAYTGYASEKQAPISNAEAIVRDYFSDIPIMIEVARCESTFRHTLSDGSVLQGRVDSADTGVMQINKRYHQNAAHAMDLNLDNIYDNMAYARHLYETQGIQPWNASAPCWNRTLAANI